MMLVENNINVVSRQELDDDALRVFGEDTGKIVEDIKNIQSWIEATPHMKNVRRDPEFLKFFLRGCNYSVASTKDKLDMFFTARWGNLRLLSVKCCLQLNNSVSSILRSLLPNWFSDMNPRDAKMEAVLRSGLFLPLRGYDARGRYTILLRLGQLEPASVAAEDAWKLILMMFNLTNEGNLQVRKPKPSSCVSSEHGCCLRPRPRGCR